MIHGLQSALLTPDAMPVGLGCARLGSVNGASSEESRALIHFALDRGIRFFDTSNIYGQGQSERILGDILVGQHDCVICSKAGKYVSAKVRALMPLKFALRALARGSKHAHNSVARVRARPMPTRWSHSYLLASIETSLRRLKRERIDMFMLHSPPAEIVVRGEAMAALEEARATGKLGTIGVSVDDVACAQAALLDPRVQVLQLPLRPGDLEFSQVLADAARQGVAVIAREILGGASCIARQVNSDQFARDRIIEMMHQPGVSLPLLGTTRIKSLAHAIEAASSVSKCTPILS